MLCCNVHLSVAHLHFFYADSSCRYCEARFKSGQRYIPLEMAQLAPPAEIDANVYTAPALIPGCAGWHPEYMKAWEGWGAPGYCW